MTLKIQYHFMLKFLYFTRLLKPKFEVSTNSPLHDLICWFSHHLMFVFLDRHNSIWQWQIAVQCLLLWLIEGSFQCSKPVLDKPPSPAPHNGRLPIRGEDTSYMTSSTRCRQLPPQIPAIKGHLHSKVPHLRGDTSQTKTPQIRRTIALETLPL